MDRRADSLVRSLFVGRLDTDGILPFPHPDAETAETTDEIVSMVRDWSLETIDPEKIDHEKHIGDEVISGMAELGLYGLTIPEEFGGSGMGQLTYSHMMEAVSHRCASVVTVLGAHLGIGMKGLLLFGTPEQKQRWLPRLATGELIGAFALTEAQAGSDAAALATTADPMPDGSWKLNGRKLWITNGGIANFFTVFARTPHPEKPDAPVAERPISAFVVLGDKDGSLDGFTIGAPEDKMGLCGSSTTEVGMEDVVIPGDCLLGPEGQGFKVALNILNSGRHGLGASCIGQAKLAREMALAHARERVQYGQPIGKFGMVQEMLAAMEADIYAMEAGTWLTAAMVDGGEHETMLESACCKMFATERLWSIANDALQVTGGTGFMREYPYERIIRDARINMIFEGTNQVLRMMIASQGLRPWVRGEAEPNPEPVTFTGVCEEFATERAELESLVPVFAQVAQATAAEHGKAVRHAQLPLKRLADMATALFGVCAVLSRVTASVGGTGASLDLDREKAVARLSIHRLIDDFHQARATGERHADELVAEVASRATGL